MKKTVKPSPYAVILFGIVAGICIIGFIIEMITEASLPITNVILFFLMTGVFVYYLMRYLGQEKIHFDENAFTVGGKTYSFDEITDVTVNNEQVLRHISTLRIKLYIGEEEICSFTKDDKGGKEFIAAMKNHGVSVSIDI